MHDPEFLLYDVPLIKLDIWHREPGGHDAFAVCGHAPNRGPSRLAWMVRHLRHLRHLRLNWRRYQKVKRWIADRCDHCGQRFRWKESRNSYQSTDRVWHDVCMTLGRVRNDLDDLTGYVLGTADSSARWRANRRLEHLEQKTKDGAAA